MYNRYRFSSEFKKEAEREVLMADITKRQELSECKKNFTLKKLLDCRENFSAYLKQYGEHEPVQTSNAWLNKASNYMLTYSHFIHTNQPYASRVKKIIDDAKENKEQLPQACAVFNALVAIKQVENEMTEWHIVGTVKSYIEGVLKKFGLDKDFTERKAIIENTLKYITELDDKARIISPTVERMGFGDNKK